MMFKKISSFIMTSILGGVTVILPAVILAVFFNWLFNLIRSLIQPLTNILEQQVEIGGLIADIIVIAFILISCFFIGLFVRTSLGKYIYGAIENNIFKAAPGYRLVKETILQLLGKKKSPFSSVALAQIFQNETLVTCFVTDETAEGTCTLFVPTAPNPTSGFIYHLNKKYVHVVDVPVEDAMRSVISCGVGSPVLIESYKMKLKKEAG